MFPIFCVTLWLIWLFRLIVSLVALFYYVRSIHLLSARLYWILIPVSAFLSPMLLPFCIFIDLPMVLIFILCCDVCLLNLDSVGYFVFCLLV